MKRNPLFSLIPFTLISVLLIGCETTEPTSEKRNGTLEVAECVDPGEGIVKGLLPKDGASFSPNDSIKIKWAYATSEVTQVTIELFPDGLARNVLAWNEKEVPQINTTQPTQWVAQIIQYTIPDNNDSSGVFRIVPGE